MKRNRCIFLLCLFILLLGFFLVLINKEAFDNTMVAIGVKEEKIFLADTVPYLQKLRNEIPVLKILPKKKKDRREIWQVGQGVSLPNYLLKAQKHLNRHGGKVLAMEEVPGPSGTTAANLDFIAPFGDTFYVALQVADSFYDNTSHLAIGFLAEKNWEKYSRELRALNYPYTLLITPSENSKKALSSEILKNGELVLWLPMEDKKLHPKSLSNSMIFVHQSDAEIQERLEELLEYLPEVEGVASRLGNRAVEQQALLRATFSPLKKRNLWFMDLTGNRYSKVLDVCKDVDLKCRTETPFNPSKQTHALYVADVLKMAKRSGNNILILPLSEASFKALEDIEEKTNVQGTEIVSLSHIFKSE